MFSKELNSMFAEMANLHEVMARDEQIVKATLQFVEQMHNAGCSDVCLCGINFPETTFWYYWMLQQIEDFEYVEQVMFYHDEELGDTAEVIFK